MDRIASSVSSGILASGAVDVSVRGGRGVVRPFGIFDGEVEEEPAHARPGGGRGGAGRGAGGLKHVQVYAQRISVKLYLNWRYEYVE